MLRIVGIVKWILKAFIAGVIAVVCLNLITYVYRGITPVIPDETKAAPNRYEPCSNFSYMVEGFSFGKLDENGFNNLYSKKDSIDYLCMGSSHMEALQVMPDENCVYHLNELLNKDENNGEYVYNLGISGYRMPDCISRLSYAIKTYNPKKAVVIETAGLDFVNSEIDEALKEAEEGKLLQQNEGIAGVLRKLPYLRIAFIQLQALLAKSDTNSVDISEPDRDLEFESLSYKTKMEPLIRKAAQNSNGRKVIMFYHPGIEIHEDGSVCTDGNQKMIQAFSELCDKYGIVFLDMSERFMKEYREDYTLPIGFVNTSVGQGHLNKYGHTMVAEELYKILMKGE